MLKGKILPLPSSAEAVIWGIHSWISSDKNRSAGLLTFPHAVQRGAACLAVTVFGFQRGGTRSYRNVGSSQTAAGRFHPFRIASTIASTAKKNEQRAVTPRAARRSVQPRDVSGSRGRTPSTGGHRVRRPEAVWAAASASGNAGDVTVPLPRWRTTCPPSLMWW